MVSSSAAESGGLKPEDYHISMEEIRYHMLDEGCSLPSIQAPNYLSASNQAVEYIATAGPITKYGATAPL